MTTEPGTTNALFVLAAGLGAGALHALSGPDHLAGVAPFAASAGRRAWRVGVGWGLGHATGALAGASFALLLRAFLPDLEVGLSTWSERAVGLVLCVVGALGVHAALRTRIETHPHGPAAGHATKHAHPAFRFPGRGSAERHPHAAFAIGTLHGLAGLSHVFVLLPALALPGFVLPATYLAGYAVASLVSITGVATTIGWTAHGGGGGRVRASVLVASLASFVVGAFWLVHAL